MKHYRTVILVILSFLLPFYSIGQVNHSDSTVVHTIVSNFFDWYINVCKNNEFNEFLPRFVEGKHGTTTLNFSTYFRNLRKLNSSKSLIKREKESYQSCLDNLAKIKYTDFMKSDQDLSYFEGIQCDFSNYQKWTGGQEICDGITFHEVNFPSNEQCIVMIDKFLFYNNKLNYDWNYYIIIELNKKKGKWEIYNITFDKKND
jgi:hypothetical protein